VSDVHPNVLANTHLQASAKAWKRNSKLLIKLAIEYGDVMIYDPKRVEKHIVSPHWSSDAMTGVRNQATIYLQGRLCK
jgi:hypothetical protein